MPALATSSLLREEKQLNHVTVPDYTRFISPLPDCPAHTSKFSAPPELVCEYQVIKTLHVPLGVVPGNPGAQTLRSTDSPRGSDECPVRGSDTWVH